VTDTDTKAEQMRTDILAMLARSPEPDAEEWAIHNTDGFDGVHISEYESIRPVLLSELGVLNARAFRLFLSLLGDALTVRLPGDTEAKAVPGRRSAPKREEAPSQPAGQKWASRCLT
jgi:hypothetical protein